jgi:hypothetical protein
VPLSRLRLERISYSAAADFFKEYEHLGNCGLGVWHWGAYDDGRLLAVVSMGTTCFSRSRGRLSSIAAEFGLGLYQITRGGTAPDAPPNTPSWAVSAALLELQKERGNCLVIAYADRAYNEIGTIYQACNGYYIGQSDPKNQSNYIIDGKVMSGWVVRKRYGTRDIAKLRDLVHSVIKVPLTNKYRYVFVQVARPMRREIVKTIQALALPYPNRLSENIPAMDVGALVKNRASRIYSPLPVDDNER